MTVSTKAREKGKARDRVLELAQTGTLFRTRDAIAHGVHAETISRMVRAGILERLGPGRYRLASAEITEHHDLVVASAATPSGVICLMSALRFHGLGTQLPYQVWVAVPRGARVPRLSHPPLKAVHISPSMFNLEVERHQLEGRIVRVYSLTRTIADCFKFRNTIGLDVALEALKEGWRSRRVSLDELNRVAKQLRVARVMQPYLETIVL